MKFRANFLNKIPKLNKLNQKSNVSTIINGPILPQKQGHLALYSLSQNIYYNLALENYLAESINESDRNILLVWLSEPCIVFGRHQNTWVECNVNESHRRGVRLARRYSGGGCVYHDQGNLNISFITNRLKFDRKLNLNLIKNSLDPLKITQNVQFEITPRHDIFVKLPDDDTAYKISGSAARLAQKFSYHHCTLLHDVNMDNMKLLKSPVAANIITKATPSVRSKCINLSQYLAADLQRIVEILCENYWRMNHSNWSIEHLFEYVNPEEHHIEPLLRKNIAELQSWEFIYGSTPKFKLNVQLDDKHVTLSVDIHAGIIREFELVNESHANDLNLINEMKSIMNQFIGCKFEASNLKSLIEKNLPTNNLYTVKFFEFLNKNFF